MQQISLIRIQRKRLRVRNLKRTDKHHSVKLNKIYVVLKQRAKYKHEYIVSMMLIFKELTEMVPAII